MEVVDTPYPKIEWGEIPGFTGFRASTDGQIKNARGKILTPRPHGSGLRVDLGKASAMVHNLVLRAFTGRPLSGRYRPKHLNGDLTDNRLDNLVWSGTLK